MKSSSVRKPLVCNSTSYNNCDYGVPISVFKSTDYRTSTGTNHRFIPPFPNDFHTGIRLPAQKVNNPVLNQDFYQSQYTANFIRHKAAKDPLSQNNPLLCTKVNYVKSFEDKMFKSPVPPIAPQKSEMKSQYKKIDVNPECQLVSPITNSICPIIAFGRGEQKPLKPDESGYLKHLDIYLTTTRADYVPYSQAQQYGIARKDAITFYDATGVPKGKGYGPRDSRVVEPLVKPRNKETIKSGRRPCRSDALNFVPNLALTSEYRDSYQRQTRSCLEPYKSGPALSFGDPMDRATPWQTLAAPGMYCTEYCHIGSGWPLDAIIERKKQRPTFKHKTGPSCLSE